MKAPTACRCGHHRLSHTYTAEGNVGRCLGHSGDLQRDHRKPCACSEFTPTEEKK